MAESFGVEDRGHFYDPVGALRDVVVNHLMQVVAAAAMEPPSGRDPDTLKDAQVAVLRAIEDADPAHYVRGQYDGYLDIDGVAPDSTTETYAALRLEIDNWRWSGVPFFIRTGKWLPVTQTEFRLVFKRPPRPRFRAGRSPADPNQLVVQLHPGRQAPRGGLGPPSAGGLGCVEGDITAAQQLVERLATIPDGNAGRERAPGGRGLSEPVDHVRHALQFGVGEQGDELIPAESRQHVAAPDRASHPVRRSPGARDRLRHGPSSR